MEVIVLARGRHRQAVTGATAREGLVVLQLPVGAGLSGRSASSAGYPAIYPLPSLK